MDEYQKEFIIKCLEKHPDKYYTIACEVATATHNECPVIVEEYLNDLCVGLKPMDIVRQFHGLNPDEWEYMIFRDTYWEGMDKQDVDRWAREMVNDNLEFCETSDIEEWNEENFHKYMWREYCIDDSTFMRNYYLNYDVYPYNGDILNRIHQFIKRWGITPDAERVSYDEDLGNGNYIYRIDFHSCYFMHQDGVAYVSLRNHGPSLCIEDSFSALPKSDPGTYKEWCARKFLDLNTKSYTLYKREANLWKLVLTLFPEEKARKELAIVFP